MSNIFWILFKKLVTNAEENVKNPSNEGIALRGGGLRRWNGETSGNAAIQTGYRRTSLRRGWTISIPVLPDVNAFW